MAPPVTSAGGTTVAGSWPADVPVMEGFGNVASTVTSGIMMLRASGTVKAEDASEFYQHLEGWQLKEGTTVQKDASGATVFAMVKEDKILQVRITATESATMLDLTYLPKR